MMSTKHFLLILIASTLICAVLQYYTEVSWIAYLVPLLILGVFLYDVRAFKAACRWAKKIDEPPAPDLGRYEAIINPAYRYSRLQSKEIADLEALNHLILSAANALPAGAVTLTPDLAITWCNRLAIKYLGINPKTDLGYNLFNIIRLPALVKYIQEENWDKPLKLNYTHKKRTRCLQFEMSRHSDQGYLLICADITQLQKLRITQQDFVANVSHEIRTPLTVLIGFLETLRDLPAEALTDEQRTHYQQLMWDQAQRMQAIVADLLTLSTLESSQLTQVEPVSMAQLIDIAKPQIQSLSKGKHQLVFHVDADLSIMGNRHELLSAITNLMTNAVRYTPENGTIDISWQRNKNQDPAFCVKDTGIGISEADLPRLTERFYRADKSRSRVSGGTGLGLAITKNIAERHGAKLVIKSQLQKGSTFSLVFPKESIVSSTDV